MAGDKTGYFQLLRPLAIIESGRDWHLALAVVKTGQDDAERLHVGRWTEDGTHKRWNGLLSKESAKRLQNALAALDYPTKK